MYYCELVDRLMADYCELVGFYAEGTMRTDDVVGTVSLLYWSLRTFCASCVVNDCFRLVDCMFSEMIRTHGFQKITFICFVKLLLVFEILGGTYTVRNCSHIL